MNDNKALAQINKAERMLESADEINDILLLRDQAAAVQVLANAQGFKDTAQRAKIFQLKAERKAGAWLSENVGNPGRFGSGDDIVGLPEEVDAKESSRWQLEAQVPEEKFNEWIDENLKNGWEITAGGLRAYAKASEGDRIDRAPGYKEARLLWATDVNTVSRLLRETILAVRESVSETIEKILKETDA